MRVEAKLWKFLSQTGKWLELQGLQVNSTYCAEPLSSLDAQR